MYKYNRSYMLHKIKIEKNYAIGINIEKTKILKVSRNTEMFEQYSK